MIAAYLVIASAFYAWMLTRAVPHEELEAALPVRPQLRLISGGMDNSKFETVAQDLDRAA